MLEGRCERGARLNEPRRVVLAAVEAVPFAKSGGLADGVSALAAELARSGLEVTLFLPAHVGVDRTAWGFRPLDSAELFARVGTRLEPFRLHAGVLPDTAVRVLLVEHPGYFGRTGIYVDPGSGRDYADAAERYVFLARALLAALPVTGPPPDILHLNDHHWALAAAYRHAGQVVPAGFLDRTAVVLGIHNLGYQGLYDASFFGLTGLPAPYMAPLAPLEFWGRMNFMKAGLVLSDVLITVSPTYAREIQHDPALGYGLEGVLRQRASDLVGILNGIDTRIWDPARDPLLPARYDREHLAGKAECKRALQERCGLSPGPGVPLFGMISRFADQKGIDLLLASLDGLLLLPLQLVLLGDGDPGYERRLIESARHHPGRMAVAVGFDDRLAHWIEAGCDFFLMPSRYEPCGLNQMYSMRYGTIPVVRHTGGLVDTVSDWDARRGTGTGFVFDRYAPDALVEAVRRAVATYPDTEAMRRLIGNGMNADFSWGNSARSYRQVYEAAIERRRAGAPLPGAPVVGTGDPGIDRGAGIRNIRAAYERE